MKTKQEATEKTEKTGTKKADALDEGFIKVPVHDSRFGRMLDLSGKLPQDCDAIMVLVNSGGGLNAGVPKPVGFIKLPHQLYLKDIARLIGQQRANFPAVWVTVIPIRSKEYVDVWGPTRTNTDRR